VDFCPPILRACRQPTPSGARSRCEFRPDPRERVELSMGSGPDCASSPVANVVRLRYTTESSFPPDESFAVLPARFRHHEDFSERILRCSCARYRRNPSRIFKSPLRIVFLDRNGQVISQDHPHNPVSFNDRFRVWKSMPSTNTIRAGGQNGAARSSRSGVHHVNMDMSAGRSPPIRCTNRFLLPWSAPRRRLRHISRQHYRSSFDFW